MPRLGPWSADRNGVTLNFHPKSDDHLMQTELQYYAKHNFKPLNAEQYNELQRELRKSRQKDSTTMGFHGYKLRFDRDTKPSFHAAYASPNQDDFLAMEQHQQQRQPLFTPYQHQHPFLYEASYILPLIVCGLLSLCLFTILYVFAVYWSWRFVKRQIRKTRNSKYEFRGVPENDTEADAEPDEDVFHSGREV
eukprot:CAMPEP_0202692446 /NCGR_PEP_ID=MMETSP1385-20130828/6824_1 /ASSEMBLY_ACC=CAM_ASM_000861 /TAXON_ID=933848 /ORGANISM="Elphidium margaritaceum" /LENGTH=192 /DNA_ID=CAMNT_0049347977 /DNA_START=17 /DNA_END=595 /DNA_ORIENTATION=+